MRESKLNIVLSNLEKETKVIFYRSSGPGGQRKNKKETAVKLYHAPTGIKVIATEFRSQSENKKHAFRRLKKKLSEFYKKKEKKNSDVNVTINERKNFQEKKDTF